MWTLYNLAKYPEHQEKCQEEVDAIFDQKGTIEWEDLKSLVYLKYCIKESLRLFPPVPGVVRMLSQPTEIDGRLMPKNTTVAAALYCLHRNPDVWENPDVCYGHCYCNYWRCKIFSLFFFRNSTPCVSLLKTLRIARHMLLWLSQLVRGEWRWELPDTIFPSSLLPSRNCIGQEFALNEERVAIAHVLRRFHLSLDETRLPEKDYLVILRPKPGLFLKLKHRHI